MKRVYMVFEDKHCGSNGPDWDWIGPPWDWYDDKFVEVFDNFPAAVASIRNWAESQSNVEKRTSARDSEELIVVSDADPYVTESYGCIKRTIKSTLLKSS